MAAHLPSSATHRATCALCFLCLHSNCSPELRSVLDGLLSKDPAKRPTARQVGSHVAQLATVAGGGGAWHGHANSLGQQGRAHAVGALATQPQPSSASVS